MGMVMKNVTQLIVADETKARLDKYKVENRSAIISKYKLRRRMVSNDLVIRFLLDKKV